MIKKILFTIVCCFTGLILLVACGARHTHNYNHSEIIENATCTESGTKRVYCSGCNDFYDAPIQALGHRYNQGVITKTATCQETGSKIFTCTACQNTYTEVVPMTEHIKIDIGTAIEATCQHSGITSGSKCKDCGIIFSEQAIIEKVDHKYESGICVWCKDEKEYTITFKINNEIVKTETFTVNTKTIEEPEIPSKEGYTASWEKYKLSANDITVNAIYTPIKYHLTLEPYEGKLESNVIQVEHSETIYLPIPNYKGKAFQGWFDSDDIQFADGEGKCIVEASLLEGKTLYARYDILKCTVTFETNGGTTINPIQYNYGDKLGEIEIPTKNGLYFVGWYSSDEEIQYTADTIIEENLTLYAKWITSTAISTAEELIAIREHPEANYHLINDINLNGNVWQGIESFSGILEGNGYAIKNFNLTSSTISSYAFIINNKGKIKNINFSNFTLNYNVNSNSYYMSIIARKNDGDIQNCHIANGVIMLEYTLNSNQEFGHKSRDFVFGSICSENTNGSVENCSSCVSLTLRLTNSSYINSPAGNNYNKIVNFIIGGIVGKNSSSIVGCEFSADISGTMAANGDNYQTNSINNIHIGGIVGLNFGGKVDKSFSNSYISIDTTSKEQGYNYGYIGGLIGMNDNSGIVRKSYSSGNMLNGTNVYNNLGGIVGLNKNGVIENTYSTVTIESNKGGSIGAFVGTNQSVIQNSYASGNVTVTSSGNVGGFAGNNDSSGTLTKCYSTGDVSGVGGNNGYFVGLNAGALFKCYFMQGAALVVSGKYEDRVIEYETIEGVLYSKLWSEEFLVDELYWDSEGWIIVTDENPLLEWELTIGHRFDTMIVEPTCEYGGFTIYNCIDCNRLFIKDFIDPIGHNYIDDETIAPLCEVDGYTLQKCSNEGCNSIRKINIVPATGHDSASSTLKSKKDATCTTNGLVVYHCDDCGNDYHEILEATGHNGIYQNTIKEPTCTEEGDDEYYCITCENTYSVSTEKIEHSWIDIEGKNPTCGIVKDNDGNIIERHPVDGNRPGVKCEVCDLIQYGCEIIPAHQFNLIETKKESTCTEKGRGLYQCSICEDEKEDDILELGHTDADRDNICDVCGELSFTLVSKDLFVHITDVAGLMNIKNNPSGYYWLDSDIDLTDVKWVALGTEKLPFKGIFYGNGHTISGFNFSSDNSEETFVAGLFGYNYGTIVNVNISNFNINVTNSNVLFGGVAAYNRGSIMNCKLNGENKIKFTVSKTITENNQEITMEYEFISGGIVGINAQTGNVENCTVSGSISSEFINDCSIKIKTITTIWQLIGQYMLQYIYKTKVSTIQHISFGGIAGRNEGTISSCSVNSKISSYSSAKADLGERLKGEAFAYTHMYAGALAGYNSGSISNCSSTTMTYDIPDGYKYVNIPYLITGKSYSTGYQITNYAKYVNAIEGVVGGNSSFGSVDNYAPINN
ncbi:MAG: InlB B-repeat-containing protein [Anaeroplasmataceae bacterium]|nr:InlB B-repeat-containing protein [Anaeroplasmataceae bacterium]